MANELPDRRRWDLADVAEFHLREFMAQPSPREAGSACRAFIVEFVERLDFPPDAEASVRYAEDQIASALLSFAALGEGRRISRPLVSVPGFHIARTYGWPIVVVYESQFAQQYSLLYENFLLTSWNEATQPVASQRSVSAINVERVRAFLGDEGDSTEFWSPALVDLLARAVTELAHAWETVRIIFIPRLPRRATAGQPTSAQSVTVLGDSASMGVIGTSNGRAVATTVAHMVGSNTVVSVGINTCNVLQVDFLQDAAMFDVSHLALASTHVRGPLVGLTPAGGVVHHFEGATSGIGSDPVIAWDAAIPWVAPSLPIQAHVYTGCVTTTGDSGAALVSPQGRVVGFAQFSSPGATPTTPFTSPSPGLSGWVWAEAVFAAFSITWPSRVTMSYLTDLWDFLNLPVDQAVDKMYHSKSKQWVAQFAPPETAPKVASAARMALKPDVHYLTVTAQKTFLPFDRVVFKTFYGAVHSTILMRAGDGEPRSITSFQGIDTALTTIDNRSGEKVVMGPRTLLELAPFKGTAIAATVALLSIEARDYAKPLLSTLQKMSDIAGVKFFEPAHAIIESLMVGVRLLSDAAGESGTQIAYAGNIVPQTGIFLIAATPLSTFNWADYVFASDYTLLHKGRPVSEMPYMVLTIESSEARVNWREISELRRLERALNDAIVGAGLGIKNPASKAGKKIEEALIAFEWNCINSPDLCASDGERIATQVREQVKATVARASTGLTSERDRSKPQGSAWTPGFSLSEIDAFPRPVE